MKLSAKVLASSTWVASGKQLPIEKASTGKPEIHYTRIYSAFRRWPANGCIDAIFTGSGPAFLRLWYPKTALFEPRRYGT